ncbi:putative quinol monooxygenase [Nocardia aurantia]|uniref:ABM domain-containing protein n=1 Tax=Nocardia aurantia TaxID=2585199 RepID=A0A7K0DNM0_9NOCA|nr:putative quinol monooxygenase [Nocardia aurantia]MQY27291.1 hypothetical protein [Nocardia aurantia]
MVIVVGVARVRPGCLGDVEDAARRMAVATRSDPGCHLYRFAADLEDPETIVSVEMWADRAALDSHLAHAHTTEFLAQVTSLVEGTPEMTFHDTLPVDLR